MIKLYRTQYKTAASNHYKINIKLLLHQTTKNLHQTATFEHQKSAPNCRKNSTETVPNYTNNCTNKHHQATPNCTKTTPNLTRFSYNSSVNEEKKREKENQERVTELRHLLTVYIKIGQGPSFTRLQIVKGLFPLSVSFRNYFKSTNDHLCHFLHNFSMLLFSNQNLHAMRYEW